jgi:hypothetical protein
MHDATWLSENERTVAHVHLTGGEVDAGLEPYAQYVMDSNSV